MRPGGNRAKGASGERELAALLKGWTVAAGLDITLSRNLSQTRGGGHDLNGTEDYGMAIEVKRVEANGINGWWAQAVRQAERVGCTPVLAHRRNRQPWRFRVEAWVYPATSGKLFIDLEESQFKIWFLSQISLYNNKS